MESLISKMENTLYNNIIENQKCMNNHIILFDLEKNRFESLLAQFISFVEEEGKRIDEEVKGAHRRDGGRKIQCSLFLKQLQEHIKKESYQQGVEDMRRKCVEAIEATAYRTGRFVGQGEGSYCLNAVEVTNLIKNVR